MKVFGILECKSHLYLLHPRIKEQKMFTQTNQKAPGNQAQLNVYSAEGITWDEIPVVKTRVGNIYAQQISALHFEQSFKLMIDSMNIDLSFARCQALISHLLDVRHFVRHLILMNSVSLLPLEVPFYRWLGFGRLRSFSKVCKEVVQSDFNSHASKCLKSELLRLTDLEDEK